MKLMIKAIIIVGAIALLQVNTAHGATDRELFMCSVDTIECPEMKPATQSVDREVAKQEVTATSTTEEEQEIIRLKAMIVLLNDLLIRLKALQ
jgi:hypothetical protein